MVWPVHGDVIDFTGIRLLEQIRVLRRRQFARDIHFHKTNDARLTTILLSLARRIVERTFERGKQSSFGKSHPFKAAVHAAIAKGLGQGPARKQMIEQKNKIVK